MAVVTLAQHRVKDFNAWKKVYDSVRPMQKEGGVRAHSVWRATNDPNLVTVTHTFDSMATAKSFFESPKLKEAMGSSGVELPSLLVSFHDEVVSGSL